MAFVCHDACNHYMVKVKILYALKSKVNFHCPMVSLGVEPITLNMILLDTHTFTLPGAFDEDRYTRQILNLIPTF